LNRVKLVLKVSQSVKRWGSHSDSGLETREGVNRLNQWVCVALKSESNAVTVS
jgi:hypothetical protein